MRARRTRLRWLLILGLLLPALIQLAGCIPSPRGVPPDRRATLDRRLIEYPTGLMLERVGENFTAATAVAVDSEGLVYVADQGRRGRQVRITRIDPDTGESHLLYPYRRRLEGRRHALDRPRLYGPVGGMVVYDGELFVTARDRASNGIILAFDLEQWRAGSNNAPVRTVAGDLPARGDHGLTAIAAHPLTGRLFFGLGSATNSGVVGIDNWDAGWLREHPGFSDRPFTDLRIFGYRFDTEDPAAGLLRPDKVNTAPFNPFRRSAQRIPAASAGRATAAIYSVDPLGGDLRVEAHGIRYPRGLDFNAFGNLYATNQGMQLRGTRPVKDDPDVVVRVPLAGGFGPRAGPGPATWFGWPDFSADLMPITQQRFQPPVPLLGRTGYTELSFLIDHDESNLLPPDRETLLTAAFPALSGAAGIASVPDATPGFEAYERMLVVALSGDRAPFANSGMPLVGRQGYRVVVVDPDRRTVGEFLHNTATADAEESGLHRPIDVAFAPDGSLYVLDLGKLRMRDGRERYRYGTGALYRLRPLPAEEPEE